MDIAPFAKPRSHFVMYLSRKMDLLVCRHDDGVLTIGGWTGRALGGLRHVEHMTALFMIFHVSSSVLSSNLAASKDGC
jgi:hypothetical protein